MFGPAATATYCLLSNMYVRLDGERYLVSGSSVTST
jgi:hypothetical protein